MSSKLSKSAQSSTTRPSRNRLVVIPHSHRVGVGLLDLDAPDVGVDWRLSS